VYIPTLTNDYSRTNKHERLGASTPPPLRGPPGARPLRLELLVGELDLSQLFILMSKRMF